MDSLEAKILIKNLLQRFKPAEHGFQLSGDLTFSEYEALQYLLVNNETLEPQEKRKLLQEEQWLESIKPLNESEKNKAAVPESAASTIEPVELYTSVLSLPQADSSKKICIDFGTAMSKVTLITDNDGFEEIEVLPLGDVTDQEEISSTMLISSVYISNDGKLLFGKKALDRSRIEVTELGEERARIDNIKRALIEEGISSELKPTLNPTNTPLTNRDIVLAYLMYLTWAIRKSLDDLGEARNIERRFAMPCLDEVKSKKVKADLSRMLGEAQILSDTFYEELEEGVAVSDFHQAVQQLKNKGNIDYPFIKEGLTEPLGVANTLLSNDEDANTNSLVMIIDVGAGTTDFSMYRMGINNKKGQRVAFEIMDSTGGIQEAGSSLDRILKAYILKKAGITPTHAEFKHIGLSLNLDIQNIKEQLFNDELCFAILANGETVEVELEEFLSVEAVKKFSGNLKNKQLEILEKVAKQFVQPAPRNVVAVVITGGGANLPMINELADRTVVVNGTNIELKRVRKVPEWIAEEYEDLELEYPRLAVSIGGARQKLIDEKGSISTTANVAGTPVLGGSYAY